MTSAYADTSIQDLGEGVKTQWGREGSPRHVRCVSFWRKINHFRGNQRSCSNKNLDWSLCSTYDKIFWIKFWRLCFVWAWSRFWSHSRATYFPPPPPPPPPPWSKLRQVNSCVKIYAASTSEVCLPTTETFFFHFSSKYRVLVLPPRNEISLLSNFFFCFSKLNCLFGFRRGKCREEIHLWLLLW